MTDATPQRSRRPLVPVALACTAFGAYSGYQGWISRQPLEIGGTVEVRSIAVASRVGGRVREVLVHEGDRVQTGQPLIALEQTDLEAQRDEARAAVDLAQAQLDRTRNGPRAEEISAAHARMITSEAALALVSRGARREDVDRARAQLAAAESAVEIARIAAVRTHGLFAGGAVSGADDDNAAAQLRTAEANRDAARNALDALVHGSRPEDVSQARARLAEASAQFANTRAGSRPEDVRVSEAQLAEARARLARAETNLREAVIVAPRPCVVEALDLRPGDMVGANQPAATLVEDDQMFVRAYVPETQLGLVHVGDRVPFTVDTFGSYVFHATVQHVNAVGEYNPRNVQTVDERADQVFLVRLGIAEGKDRLRAGMAASVHLARRSP